MNQRYQRACEIVGCDPSWPKEYFHSKSIEHLAARCDSVSFEKLADVFTFTTESGLFFKNTRYSRRSGDTLTEALTEAVLAVEQT